MQECKRSLDLLSPPITELNLYTDSSYSTAPCSGRCPWAHGVIIKWCCSYSRSATPETANPSHHRRQTGCPKPLKMVNDVLFYKRWGSGTRKRIFACWMALLPVLFKLELAICPASGFAPRVKVTVFLNGVPILRGDSLAVHTNAI